MTHTTLSAPTPRLLPPKGGVGAWLPIAVAALVAVGAIVLGLTAWRRPDGSPFQPEDGPFAAAILPAAVLAAIVALAGVGAVVTLVCLVAGRPRAVPRPRPPVVAVLVGEVVVLGFGLGSVSSIALAGYLLALALPVLLAVLVVQAVRRYARIRWATVASVVAFVIWGVQTSALDPATLSRLGAGLASGFATAAPRLLVAVLSTAATASFGLLLVREMTGTDAGTRVGAYVSRHRTVWTVVAAGCALPYGLVRMTWFTPWPLLGQSEELTDETRLWGLLLGGAALFGAVLTLGLVRPWGERFPRWMPRLAGRAVPVAAAAVPGGIVAAVVSTSALPMLVGLTFSDAGTALGVDTLLEKVAMALVFPFWLWGPMLALAVWGYVVHRHETPRLAG